MKTATENRQKNLEDIVKKAKDENSKVIELSFITTVEAENARAEAHLVEQEREQRLSLLAEERARLARDKASNKAAADERRRIADQVRTRCFPSPTYSLLSSNARNGCEKKRTRRKSAN